MSVITCRSCGWQMRSGASRRIIAACICPKCRAPLVNAEIVEDA
jgi:RNase P subunit RPR2